MLPSPQSIGSCSVTKSCPTLCDPMDCSMPGLHVPHHLQEFAQVHVHWWCHPTILSSATLFFCLQSFPASGSFLVSQLFTSSGQSIRSAASASVLPMTVGLTGLISLLSKGLSRVSSHITVQKYQFFGTQLSLWSNFHIHTWLLEKS